jgi:hypothetical protein
MSVHPHHQQSGSARLRHRRLLRLAAGSIGRNGSRRTLSSNVDQGEAGFGILAFAQIARRLDQDHFQGGPDICLDQVTADHAAVGFAENRMEAQGRALIADRDIAEQQQDLDLQWIFGTVSLLYR